MNKHGLIVLAFAGLCCAIPWETAAQSLRLADAVNRSLAANPSLTAAHSDLGAVRARAEREGMPPQYRVSGEVENLGGTGATSGIKSAQTTLRLSRVIELGGKQKARENLGTAQIDYQNNAILLGRINVASMTTARFISVVAEQKRVEVAKERVRLAEMTCREVANWVKAARNPESDLHASEIALADARLALENAQRKLDMARMTLASSWGATFPDFGDVIGDLEILPAVDSFEKLAEQIPLTPGFQSTNMEAATIMARRKLAVSSSEPDLDVSVGIRRQETTHDHALVASISIPLGSKPRANLAIAEADAQLSALQARQEALQSETHQILFARYQEIMQTRLEFNMLNESMIPHAEQAFAFTTKGFKAGRFSFLLLAQAQTTLFELQQRRVDAAARYHISLAEIERLTALSPEY